MDKGGFFLVYRGVFPDFGDAPYTEREAWLWLIASAGYENGNMGEIETSLSELARAWSWRYGKRPVQDNAVKVKRFLVKMALQERLTFCKENVKKNESGCKGKCKETYLIKITNYAAYQRRDYPQCKDVCKGVKVSLSQKCKEDPCFIESIQQPTNPKQETIKRNNNTVQVTNVTCLSEPVNPKPNSQVQTDTPVVKTKAQIKREKAEAKKADREQQLFDIESNLFSFEVEYPLVDIDLEFRKMVYWLNNTTKGKIRTDINKTWTKWLFTEQTRLNTMKLFPRNNKNTQKQESPESFLDQVRRESQKLQQINERFTK